MDAVGHDGHVAEGTRHLLLAGRDLAEKLRITDSIAHYDKALALDPNFALAELNRAQSSPTAKEFFEHLKKAVTLSDKASDGERMLIQAAEAGAVAAFRRQPAQFLRPPAARRARRADSQGIRPR